MLLSDTKRAHVLKDLQGHFHLIVLNASNDKRFVKSKVTLDASLFHHLLGHEGFLNVAILAVAFNHDTISDEVGFAGNGCIWLKHLLENLFRLRYIKTPDAAIEQRVESHDVRCYVLV